MPRSKKRAAAPPEAAAPAPALPAEKPAVALPGDLRLEYRSPAELAENPRNWRTHPPQQVAALAGVISEVGWAGACLYNERTGRLIDGHARRKVAMEQGCERVPVLIGSWDEAAEAKILATLDPLSAMAGANAATLESLLRDVATGDLAVADMLADLAEKSGIIPPAPDDGFEPKTDPSIDAGDVTPDDVAGAGDDLDDKIGDDKLLAPVVCPHCAGEFSVDVEDLRRDIKRIAQRPA